MLTIIYQFEDFIVNFYQADDLKIRYLDGITNCEQAELDHEYNSMLKLVYELVNDFICIFLFSFLL